eukprot:Skav210752  [mRNA]  locus=scaffold1498:120794:126919:+ [translate_table: standard]
MTFLCTQGLRRAVLYSHDVVAEHFEICTFHHSVGSLRAKSSTQRSPSWPNNTTGVHRSIGPIWDRGQSVTAKPDCVLSTSFSPASAVELCCSGHDVLRRDLPCDPFALDQWSLIEPYLQGCELPLSYFDRLLIYTDGSAIPQPRQHSPDSIPDAWSFLVLGECVQSDGQCAITFLGWRAAPVQYTSGHPHCWGTTLHGSDQAEREALLWAGLWRCLQDVDTPTVFVSDSDLTLGTATGAYQVPSRQLPAQLLRGIFHFLEQGIGRASLSTHHTYGHCGDLWNETADSLAGLGRTSPDLPPWPIDLATLQQHIPFWWLAASSSSTTMRWSPFGFHIPPPSLPSTCSTTTPVLETGEQTLLSVDICVCSANVNSMYTGAHGFGGKLAYLAAQFQNFGIWCIGVQEARTPRGFYTSHDYLRYCSGSDNGNLGVELWLSTSIPYGSHGTRPCYLRKEHCVVVHADPRLLVVNVQAPGLNLCLIVGHAPHSGHPEQARADWWEHLQSLLGRLPSSDHRIALLDANAPMGPVDGTTVLFRGTQPSQSTPCFRDFLTASHLCVAGSFQVHEGTPYTWTTPDGLHERDLDHVLLDASMVPLCQWSGVLADLDISGGHHDHDAIACQLRWTTWCGSATPAPSLRFDRSKIVGNPALETAFAGCSTVPWSTDIETEVDTVAGALISSLREHCPIERRKPKKPYVSEEAWQLRSICASTTSSIRLSHRLERVELLKSVFVSWRHLRPSINAREQPSMSLCSSYRQVLLCGRLRLVARLQSARSRLKFLPKKDKNTHLAAVVATFKDSTPAQDVLTTLRPFVGPSNAKRFFEQPLPQVRNSQGDACATPDEALDTWIEFFRLMEGGERMTVHDLRRHWVRHLSDFLQPQLDLPLDEVPSLCDLETACRKVKCGKALGPDGLPPELFHGYPQSMARLMYQSLLKLISHGQETIAHKGGRLAIAYKHKGPSDICSNFRSLLISSHFGKSIHRSLRQKQSHLYESYLQLQQVGGRQRMPVTLASHQLKAFARHLEHSRRPGVVLFLDLTEAFYRVLRPLITGQTYTDSEVAQFVQQLHLPPDVLHDLYRHLQEPTALDLAGVPASVKRVAAALHTDTHFWLPHLQDCCRTTRGTRPGDSWADVVFGFLWARILKSCEQQFARCEILEHLPYTAHPGLWATPSTTETRPYLGPCWMDDLAICLSGNTCQAVLRKATCATGILLDLCVSHGLCPNLRAGKTELMFTLRGSGKREVQQLLFGPSSPQTLKVLGEHQSYEVALTGSYTHLGSRLHHKGHCITDIRRRVALGHQTLTKHSRLLFTNKHLSVAQRSGLFQTLVESKMTYGLESWTFSPPRCLSTWTSAIHRMYRRLLKLRPDAHIHPDALLHRVGLPAADELLRRNRLRYLAVLYANLDSSLWQMILCDESWLALCKADLYWMWLQLRRSSDLPSPNEAWLPWEQLLKDNPKRWKGLVKRAFAHAQLQRSNRHVVDSLHRDIAQALNATVDQAPLHQSAPPSQVPPELHACLACTRSFKSKAGLHAHLFKVHHRAAAVRYCFEGSQCPCCLKEYHVPSKLHNHLHHCGPCREHVLRTQNRVVPIPGRGSKSNQVLETAHSGLEPVSQGFGPQPEHVPPPDAFDELYVADLENTLVEIIMDLSDVLDDAAARALICHGVHQHAVTIPEAIHTIALLPGLYGAREADIAGITELRLQNILEPLLDVETWRQIIDERSVSAQHQQPASLCSATNIEAWILPETPTAPLGGLYRERIVLHLFSGRRRAGDLQHWLERMSASHPEYDLIVVSLDIICDSQWGDVSSPSVCEYWYTSIRSGYVSGMVAGPPCETWSVARSRALADDPRHRGPRPVRDAYSLWGFDALRVKECLQVLLGNTLLGFTLQAFVLMQLSGGIAAVEHPERPDGDADPSIWKLPLMQLILTLDGVELLHLNQGDLGAPSAKPTALLVLNAPGMAAALQSWRISWGAYPEMSIGRDAQGTFLTNRLKEYPPAMCAGLSEGLLTAFSARATVAHGTVPADFIARCTAMQCSFSQHLGHDFAGHNV